jgi:host factor-I protein
MLNLQDLFLNQLRKDRTMVTVYLTNGFQLRGYVRGFDTFTVIIENEGRQNLVYKNAISTITPTRPVRLLDSADSPEEQGQQ